MIHFINYFVKENKYVYALPQVFELQCRKHTAQKVAKIFVFNKANFNDKQQLKQKQY